MSVTPRSSSTGLVQSDTYHATTRLRGFQRRAGVVVAVGFVALLVGVVTGATQAWDQRVVDWFRPDESWGLLQVRLVDFIDGLEPRHSYPLLVLVTVLVALRRRSWRPALFAGTVATMSVATTLTIKMVTRRPDWHGDLTSSGGSFPSGHVVGLLVCLGTCLLLCWSRTRWWHWVLVAVPVGALALALTATAAHWLSDVLGGLLVAVALLCWAACSPLRAGAYPMWGSAAADRRNDLGGTGQFVP